MSREYPSPITRHEHYLKAIADRAESSALGNKMGALIDTATGSIASFVPDATVPTVRGLTVDVEPVQDLHGYDSPWPAGGGKQLLNIAPQSGTVSGVSYSVDSDGYITLNGTAGTVCNIYLAQHIQPINSQVTLSSDTNIPGGIYTGLVVQSDSTGVLEVTPGVPTKTSGVDGVTVETRYRIYIVNGTVLNNYKFRIMLNYGTSALAYSPYSNICPISGWDSVEVQRTGKNLLKLDESEMVSTGWNRRFPISLKAGTYIISCQNQFGASTKGASVNLTDENDATIIKELTSGYTFGDTTFVGTAATITEEEAKKIKNIRFALRASGTTYNDIAQGDIQLELGSTATAYTPYQGDTYQIQLGQTVYGGTVDAVNGVLTVDRAMVDLGSFVWNYNTTYAFFTSNSIPTRKIGVLNVWSDLFKTMGGSWSGTPVQNALWGNGSNTTLYVQIPPLDNVDDFMALVDGHQLMYELATPITIDLTPIEISILTGQTNNIWADCGNVSVEYAADLKTYIDNKIAAASSSPIVGTATVGTAVVE